MENNINYKKSQIYKIFELICNTKDISTPIIIGEYDYDTLSKNDDINDKYKAGYITLINKNEDGSFGRFILKIRDYGYTTKTITCVYELAKYFDIDFLLSNISEEYIMKITLKINEKIFSDSEKTTIYMFAISQLFVQILITILIRKRIYIKDTYYYDDKKYSYKNIQDVIQSIIDIENLSGKNAEITLNNFINGENIIISDIFWALDKLYILHEHILSDNALQFLKEYNNSLYLSKNEYIIRKNKDNTLNKKDIKEILIKDIIDNIFYRNNVVFIHFKYLQLCSYNIEIKYQTKIILYLIKKVGIDKIKNLYLNNITFKNNLSESIVNLLLEKYNNIIDTNFDELKLFIDEKTSRIYY